MWPSPIQTVWHCDQIGRTNVHLQPHMAKHFNSFTNWRLHQQRHRGDSKIGTFPPHVLHPWLHSTTMEWCHSDNTVEWYTDSMERRHDFLPMSKNWQSSLCFLCPRQSQTKTTLMTTPPYHCSHETGTNSTSSKQSWTGNRHEGYGPVKHSSTWDRKSVV